MTPNFSFSRFNMIVILSFFGMLFALVLKNLLLDPFGVFGTGTLPLGPSTNERYLKIEHVCSQEAGTYDSVVLGSSRSGMTSPGAFFPDKRAKAYNLAVFSGKPTDFLLLYAAFVKCQGTPRRVAVGLDVMSFFVEVDGSDLSRRHHPIAAGISPRDFVADYLLDPSPLVSLWKLAQRKNPPISFDFTVGTYALDTLDRIIAQAPEEYLSRFDELSTTPVEVELDQNELDALTRLVSLLRADGVSNVFFVQPMHASWKKRLLSFRTSVLSRIDPIVTCLDFTDFGSDKNTLWYEEKHYRSPLAALVASKVTSEFATADAIPFETLSGAGR